jgi:8-oxo-(d)GTP phosphatase
VHRNAASESEVLVARRADGVWVLPKGKLGRGESPRTAAVREVAEETGLKVRLGIELGAYTFPIGPQRYKYVHWYTARSHQGTPIPDGRELVELRWVPVVEAAELLQARDARVVGTFAELNEAGLV